LTARLTCGVGKSRGEGEAMPIIRVDGPKVTDLDKKREFVRTVTDAASSLYALPKQAIV